MLREFHTHFHNDTDLDKAKLGEDTLDQEESPNFANLHTP
jgi:hypothetical protein